MRPLLLLGTLTLLLGHGLQAQAPRSRPQLQAAMKAELDRSFRGLELPGLGKPFYIGYTLRDLDLTSVRASLGGLIASSSRPFRDHRVDLLVGDAFRNNANFIDLQGLMAPLPFLGQVPLEDDPAGIRTALWLATDAQYKAASEAFERKRSALRHQRLPEAWERVPDLDQPQPCAPPPAPAPALLATAPWEGAVRDLSAILLEHPGIHASEASFHFIRGDQHFVSTQTPPVILPVGLAALHVGLETQATDGMPLADSIVAYGSGPGDLPDLAQVRREVETAARHLEALREAPLMEEAYDGPVLFEGQAVAELFAQRLFSPAAPGLVALRKPVMDGPQVASYLRNVPDSLENRLGTRILPRGFGLKAVPSLRTFAGTPLVGSFAVDAQGVAPPAEVTLVEQGLIKDLLRGRIPTPRCPASNGHQRPLLDLYQVGEAPGPGVIELTVPEGEARTLEDLRQSLRRLAKEAGLPHAYIVRKLASPTAAFRQASAPAFPTPAEQEQLGALVALFRVQVDTGREEPVRNGLLGRMPLAVLRHLAGATACRQAHNTLLPPMTYAHQGTVPGREGWQPRGVPCSFIVPAGVLFEEMELGRETLSMAPRLPIAPSPLVAVPAGRASR